MNETPRNPPANEDSDRRVVFVIATPHGFAESDAECAWQEWLSHRQDVEMMGVSRRRATVRTTNETIALLRAHFGNLVIEPLSERHL